MSFLGIGKSANTRASDYIKANPPLNCDPTTLNECSYPGTAADFAQFRQQWIDNCATDKSSGLFTSKNSTRNSCQMVFDAATEDVQFQIAAENKADLDKLKLTLSKDNIGWYIFGIAFVAVVFYLLFSK